MFIGTKCIQDRVFVNHCEGINLIVIDISVEIEGKPFGNLLRIDEFQSGIVTFLYILENSIDQDTSRSRTRNSGDGSIGKSMIGRTIKIALIPTCLESQFYGIGKLWSKSRISYFNNFSIIIFWKNTNVHLIRSIDTAIVKSREFILVIDFIG